MNARTWVIIAVMAAFSGSAAFAEKIDNPMYGYWAKFKPGSVLKTTSETDAGGQKITIDSVSTLLEVTSEKITVEIKTDSRSGDTKLKQHTKKQEALAKIDRPAGAGVIKHSAEEITVAGKTYKCQLSEETRESMTIKTWTNDQIPGGLVKAEMRSEGLSVTTLLVDSTVKK